MHKPGMTPDNTCKSAMIQEMTKFTESFISNYPVNYLNIQTISSACGLKNMMGTLHWPVWMVG
jgi:hypothetical protein